MWSVHFFLLASLLVISSHLSQSSRVYELADKFLQGYKNEDRHWLVKFYAPWCHFCKDLEPIYMQVAQRLAKEGSSVIVGKLDCTKYPNIEFPVRGFPTILFISKEFTVEFDGDRNIDDITDFARRLSGPAIRRLKTCNGTLSKLVDDHEVLFLHVSNNETYPEYFIKGASKFRSLNWFYGATLPCSTLQEGTYVIKKIPNDILLTRYEADAFEGTFNQWIKLNRFPQLIKVTQGILPHLFKTGKILIVAVLEEHSSVGRLESSKHEEMRDLVEAVSFTYKPNDMFMFGWSPAIHIVNRFTIHSIDELPALVAINSTNHEYILLKGQVLPQDLIKLLDDIASGNANFQGGNSYWSQTKRMLFDFTTSVAEMYRANPVLTLLLFGLPTTFFLFIMYSIFFSDFVDAPDDENEDEEELLENHEKHE